MKLTEKYDENELNHWWGMKTQWTQHNEEWTDSTELHNEQDKMKNVEIACKNEQDRMKNEQRIQNEQDMNLTEWRHINLMHEHDEWRHKTW